MNNKFRSFVKTFLLVLAFLSILIIYSAAADEKAGDEVPERQRPNAVERAIGLSLGPWDIIKSWVHLVKLRFRPPDSNVNMEIPDNSGVKMKDAATKSFKTSKSAAENAAEAAGSVVHQTVEKVKRSVLHTEQSTPSADEDL